MSYITWRTKSGSIGSVSQSIYFDVKLDAIDSNNSLLEFTHIAGKMPLGLRVSTDGHVKGVPVIDSTGPSKSITHTFTVRANTPAGVIADRTFTITVNNFSPIQITAGSGVLGSFDDGKFISHQFTAISDNPSPTLTWSIVPGTGEPPLDMVTGKPITLTSSGLLEGYIGRLLDTSAQLAGYDNTHEDVFPYDFSPTSQDRVYTFDVMVTDGSSVDVAHVRIDVVSKGKFTSDNTITIVNNTFLTVDANSSYPPIITTDPNTLPVLTAGDNFSFKFDAVDPENSDIFWTQTNMAPTGLTISSVTGWMSGTISAQTETQKTYSFGVTAYKFDGGNNAIYSATLPVNLTTVKDSTNYISWITQANLGVMINGSISEFLITAVNNAGKPLTYMLDPASTNHLPSGLSLISTDLGAEIVGTAGFEYFSLDNASANITVASTTGITTGMAVEGPGVASGSTVLGVYGANTVKIAPATFITEGSSISFVDLIHNITITTQLTDLSTTTTFDGGATTWDNTYKFTVKAETTDHSVNSTKTFTILINNYNRAPYENMYLQALLSLDQRETFRSIINNTTLFPPELIYRADDPNFGLAKSMSMLFLPGLTVSTLASIANSTALNHYNKAINFGNIKTARAVDANLKTKYEVVYIDIGDDKEVDGVSTALSAKPDGSQPYLDVDGTTYTTIYPNSFQNMQYRLASGLGYSNRGALPNWMTARQDDGRVLGLVHAIVLAYTVPGASKLIAFRLKDNGIKFNTIHFVADRYLVGAALVANYNPATNNFFPTLQEAWDKYIKYPQIGVYK